MHTGGRGGVAERRSSRSGSVEMEREVVRQHRELDALFGEVREAFAEPDPCAEARRVLRRLSRALDAHFLQEDELYYPAIAALRPDSREQLRALGRSHDEFREELAAIDAELAADRLEPAEEAFSRFAEGFARHEAAEERILRAIDRELAAAR